MSLCLAGDSNDPPVDRQADRGGRTGMVEYTNEGNYVATYWMPTDAALEGAGRHAEGYGYDVRALRRRNVMVSSSFTGWNNMMDFGKLVADPEAMKRFGNTVVVWNLHARKPRKVWTCPARRWRYAVPGSRTTRRASCAMSTPRRSWIRCSSGTTSLPWRSIATPRARVVVAGE